MTKITLNEALDKSVDKMGFLQQRLWQWRLRRASKRRMVIEHLQEQLADDPRAMAMNVAPVMGSATFDPDTPFEVKESQFQDFLDLILEYLPRILEMIMAFFVLLPFIILTLTFATGDDATAETKMSMEVESDADFVPFTASELTQPDVSDEAVAELTGIGRTAPAEYESKAACEQASVASQRSCSAETACAAPQRSRCVTEAPVAPNRGSPACSQDSSLQNRRAGPVRQIIQRRPLRQRLRAGSGPVRRLFRCRLRR